MISPKIKTYLERLSASKKRPNTYLFHGPDESGKVEAAFHFIAKLSGKSGDDEFLRRSMENIHPDVVVVSPETVKDKKGMIREKEISISQIRDMQERVKFFPYELSYKFCLIKKAELLNVQAQNSLLKVLEEPTEKTFFILLASDAELILPTIYSRCAAIRFVKNELPAWNEKSRKSLKSVFKNEIHEKFAFAQELSKNRKEALAVLEDWEKIMAEGMREVLGKGDEKERLKIRITEKLIQKNREAINKIRHSNANPRTILEDVLLDMRWA